MRRVASAGLFLLLVVAGSLSGLLPTIDTKLQDMRFSLAPRQASGDIVLVQIDARSLNTVGSWPWSRNIHAKLIDKLREAGARDIALDIDFSHPARNAIEDDELEAALSRAQGSVILPAFRQPLVSGDPDSPIYVSKPLQRLARFSWPAIVNVWPEGDGLVRHLERVSTLDGEAVASMAQLVVGGAAARSSRFAIDFSIEPVSIPRISASDVVDGSFDPAAVAGKIAIVGATAVELGDRFAVPVYGIVAGAEFQALAADSLLQDRAIEDADTIINLAALAAVLLLIGYGLLYPNWRRDPLLFAATSLGLETLAFYLFDRFGVCFATAHLHALILAYLCWRGLEEINIRKLIAQIANTERDNSDMLLGRVLDDSFDGVVIVDENGKVLMANRMARSFMRSGMAGRGVEALEDVLAPGFSAHAVKAVQAVLGDHAGFLEVEFGVSQEKGQRYLELVATRSILHGERGGRVVTLTFRDVTERRLAADAIAQAADEAHAANRAKSSFLATVSHELRTPLNAIIGFSDILKREMFGKLGDTRYQDYAGHIGDSGAHLLRIVNNILDITRIEAGNLSLQEDNIRLADLFNDLTSTLGGLPGGSERTLETRIEPPDLAVIGDPQVMRQIMLNLLSNAVKFTHAGDGRIAIRAKLDTDNAVRIEVQDNGVGIDAEHLPSLAKPFYQVDGRLARQHEGAGLGLALVNGYVAAHGGRLEIDSKLGEGTTVSIVLPADRVKRQRVAA